jgi:hypothetical protein
VVTKQLSIRWLSASHLCKWAWSKGYYWHSKGWRSRHEADFWVSVVSFTSSSLA